MTANLPTHWLQICRCFYSCEHHPFLGLILSLAVASHHNQKTTRNSGHLPSPQIRQPSRHPSPWAGLRRPKPNPRSPEHRPDHPRCSSSTPRTTPASPATATSTRSASWTRARVVRNLAREAPSRAQSRAKL